MVAFSASSTLPVSASTRSRASAWRARGATRIASAAAKRMAKNGDLRNSTLTVPVLVKTRLVKGGPANIRVSSMSGVPRGSTCRLTLRRAQTYTGRGVENRGFARPIHPPKRAEFRRNLCLDSGAAALGARQLCACVLLQHELGARELGKTAAYRDKFIESSTFDHASVVEKQDARGVANGGQAMGDDKGRASLHHLIERRIDLGFGHGIERAGCFIEDQNRRVFQERPCNRQPPALARPQTVPR